MLTTHCVQQNDDSTSRPLLEAIFSIAIVLGFLNTGTLHAVQHCLGFFLYSDFKFFSTQLSHPISWSLLHGLLDTMLSLLYAETKECCLIAKKKPMYKTERKTEKARSMVQERHLASSRNNILHVYRHIHASHP